MDARVLHLRPLGGPWIGAIAALVLLALFVVGWAGAGAVQWHTQYGLAVWAGSMGW